MRKLAEQKRFDNRRKVLPGYPVETPFENLEEVKKYLSSSRIKCLLCGKSYRKLGTHINKIHEMEVDEYREQFNIPWTYGLLSLNSKERHRSVAVKMLASGWKPPVGSGVQVIDHSTMYRRRCPFRTEISLQNLGDLAVRK